ncbi:MAG: hypothetical protein AAGD09_16390 [Cyanobacteria bacterium P01_F01_bin.56]
MGRLILNRTQQKALFLFGVTFIYLLVVTYLDFLRGPIWWDEGDFWQSSLTFSDSLIPTVNDLKTYNSLNTPLPFIFFGLQEYLFGGGIFGGRLLNLILSLGIVAMIGWPTKERGSRALLCLIGLFICPYFLWLSGRLYTEMVACTWVLLGMVTYVHSRHILSGIAFVLAIASRQYMLAFPVAIATYEFLRAARECYGQKSINWRRQIAWIAPMLAALSIFGWFSLFQGLAPVSATVDKAPAVQKTLWALEFGRAVNFLSFIGLYIVIPELILFPPIRPLELVKENWKKWLAISVLLLIFCLASPPPVLGNGNVFKMARLLSDYPFQFCLYYGLALLACLRFARPDLMFWIVAFHAAMMTKALPWDRYVLPLVVVFWYLKPIFPGLVIPQATYRDDETNVTPATQLTPSNSASTD